MITAQVVNGVIVGLGYSLVAMGWALVFGVLGKLNMAHGQMFMGSAVTAWLVWEAMVDGSTITAATIVIAALVAIVAGGLLGLLVYFTGFRVLRDDGDLPPIATTLSLASIAGAVAIAAIGSEPKQVRGTDIGGVIGILGARIATVQVVIAVVALVIALVLLYVINRSPWGRRVRAISESAQTAKRAGIRVERMIAQVFVVSGAIAGIGAFLFMVRTGSVSPGMGDDFLIRGLVVMVVGGLGRVSGALMAGIFVGMVEGLAIGLVPGQYSQLASWSVIFALLLARPNGLLRTSIVH